VESKFIKSLIQDTDIDEKYYPIIKYVNKSRVEVTKYKNNFLRTQIEYNNG
jgi:hypothetical protein